MKLDRRQVLRGAGAVVALPFLESIAPRRAYAQMGGPTKRFVAFYVPNGIHMRAWTPAGRGTRWETTPILAPLEPFRDAINIVSGLRNEPAYPDGPGDHAAGTGSFLSAAHCFKTEGAGIENGISIDQLIANAVGQEHRFPSLVLGSEGGGNAGGCDSGYSCAYSRNISWTGDTTPAAKEVTPRSVFNRLFGSHDAGLTQAQVARRKLYRKSVLDFVRGDAERLKPKLGRTDTRKLDEYLTSVRELERQIELTEAQRCDAGVVPGRPEDLRGHVRQMLDLLVVALQCDLTSVATYMLGNGGSNRPFPWLGIADGHHQISHHQDNPANFAMLQTIDIWEMEQVAWLLGRLQGIEDRDGGTLLDNTLLFFSSEIADGNSHAHRDLPVLLAGGAGGQLRGGRHLDFAEKPAIADLFVRFAQLMGVDVTTFGDDGTGPLDLS